MAIENARARLLYLPSYSPDLNPIEQWFAKLKAFIDDPLKPDDALLEAKRSAANQWFMNTLLSRLDDKRTGAIVVVMQCVHIDKPTGFLLGQPDEWDVLSLPAVAYFDETIPLSWVNIPIAAKLWGRAVPRARAASCFGRLETPDRQRCVQARSIRNRRRTAGRRDGEAPLDQTLFGIPARIRPPVHAAKLGHGQ